jgi:hypothetical protein
MICTTFIGAVLFSALGYIHGIVALLGVAPIISILKNLTNKAYNNVTLLEYFS